MEHEVDAADGGTAQAKTLILPNVDPATLHQVLPMFYLELVSGLRKGELVALLWDDLDVENRTIFVSKQHVQGRKF